MKINVNEIIGNKSNGVDITLENATEKSTTSITIDYDLHFISALRKRKMQKQLQSAVKRRSTSQNTKMPEWCKDLNSKQPLNNNN